MKCITLTQFFLIAIFFEIQAQLPKFEITTNLKEKNTKKIIYIHRINTSQFDSLITSNPNAVIHFMQPWCSGVPMWINKVDTLHRILENKRIPFFLFFDTQEEDKYFKIEGEEIGMGAYYILKYHLDFPIYIISSNEEIELYRRVLSTKFKTRVTNKKYCFYIKNGKLKYKTYTYKFYKKIFKKIR